MAKLPRNVRKQAREAERLAKQYAEQGEQGEDVNPPVPPPDPSEAPQPPGNPEPVDWEARWKGLKQSHDKTVTDLRGENENLKGEIAELRELVEKASQQAPAAQAANLFTEEEKEKYGEDFLELVERVAGARPDSDTSDIAKELKELKEGLGDLRNTQTKTQEDLFFDALDELVPDWEKVNEDDRFKAWLAEEMPLTGFERQHFLNQARGQFDAKRAAAIFNSWKQGTGTPTPTPQSHTTANSDVPTSADGQRDTYVFSRGEIAKFYDDMRRGKFRGKEQEARQIEERIFKAQNEGRVRA